MTSAFTNAGAWSRDEDHDSTTPTKQVFPASGSYTVQLKVDKMNTRWSFAVGVLPESTPLNSCGIQGNNSSLFV